jgi:hypothetical protein
VALHVDDRFAQGAVGLDQPLGQLRVEPAFEFVHQWSALRLVVRQTRRGTPLLGASLLVLIEARAEHLEHHVACVRKDLGEVTELAAPRRQAVTADHRRLIDQGIARQRIRHDQRVGAPCRPLVQQALEVFPRMQAPGVIQHGRVLPHLHG